MSPSRQQLPDAWAAKTSCPFCQTIQMQVRRAAGYTDQMFCPNCSAAFEIEEDGNHVMLASVPAGMKKDLIGRWFSMAELIDIGQRYRQYLQRKAAQPAAGQAAPAGRAVQARSAAAVQVKPAQAAPPASAPAAEAVPLKHELVLEDLEEPLRTSLKEAADQAVQLYRLKNTPAQIRSNLQETRHLTPEYMNVVMRDVEQMDQNKRSQERKKMYTCGSIVIIVFLLIVCVAGAIWGIQTLLRNSNTPLDELSQGPGAAPAQVIDEIPSPIRTMLPAGMNIISVPTPAVIEEAASGISHMKCPSNAIEAAQVFGGSAANWDIGEMGNGWVMATTEPATIKVPETMTAGYMVVSLSGMEMKSVIGPVTLKDIYMISIACD